MPTIQISDEVREVLGPEATERTLSVSLADGKCFSCKDAIDPQGTAAAVVIYNSSFTYVGYTHPTCSPSRAIQAPEDEQGPLSNGEAVTASVSAGLIEHGNTLLPTLINEISVRSYGRTGPGGGELVDLLASHLLGLGFSLVGRLREAPRKVEGWRAELTPTGTDGLFTEAKLLLVEPNGTVFYDGDVHLPPQWLDEVERFGWCVLYVGNPGVADLPFTELKARLRALRAAAGEGRLVGARLPITITNS